MILITILQGLIAWFIATLFVPAKIILYLLVLGVVLVVIGAAFKGK